MQEFAVDTSGWALGWEALVAIGTLGLAVATVVLAAQTRALARQTTKDVEAQFVPILLPGDRPAQSSWQLCVEVRNAGHSAALHIRAWWKDDATAYGPFDLGPDAGRNLFFTLSTNPIRPNSSRWLCLEYQNVPGTAWYRSAFLIARNPDPRRGAGEPRRTDYYYADSEHETGVTPMALRLVENRLEQPDGRAEGFS